MIRYIEKYTISVTCMGYKDRRSYYLRKLSSSKFFGRIERLLPGIFKSAQHSKTDLIKTMLDLKYSFQQGYTVFFWSANLWRTEWEIDLLTESLWVASLKDSIIGYVSTKTTLDLGNLSKRGILRDCFQCG